jgi:hypothetical protein
MRWAGYIARMGEMRRNAYSVPVGKPEGRNHAEDQGVDGRIMLEWILADYGGKVWHRVIWLKIETGGGLL